MLCLILKHFGSGYSLKEVFLYSSWRVRDFKFGSEIHRYYAERFPICTSREKSVQKNVLS